MDISYVFKTYKSNAMALVLEDAKTIIQKMLKLNDSSFIVDRINNILKNRKNDQRL